MMVVTYLPRMIPLVVLSKVEIPELVLRWLRYVPVAVLASLLSQNIFLVGNKLDLAHLQIYGVAAIPCFLVAIYTRNLFYTAFSGMGAVVIIRQVIGL